MNKRITFVAQLSLSGSRWIDHVGEQEVRVGVGWHDLQAEPVAWWQDSLQWS